MAFVDRTNNPSLSPIRADVCANCNVSAGATLGTGDGAVVLLKNCAACLLVKYCSVDCQRAHRSQHKKACKKRAAELKDALLYSQGLERPEGDFCPICTLPIPLPMADHSVFNVCCMKKVCNGCAVAAEIRGMDGNCAFCRTPNPTDNASALAMAQKRIDAGDAEAINFLAVSYFLGAYGMKKDIQRAIELWADAVDLGSVHAHFRLGSSYYSGDGVDQDKVRAVELWQHAAMKGDACSRAGLGCVEYHAGNCDLAMKHYLISAKMGCKGSLDFVKLMFMEGDATKAQYAEALKGYGDAVEETKSHQREEAKRVMEERRKGMYASL